jgi:hypothetical protein
MSPPHVPTLAQPGSGSQFMAPGTPLADMTLNAGAVGKRIEQMGTDRGKWSDMRDHAQQGELDNQSQLQTLNSLESAVEKSGGKLPTGPGAPEFAELKSLVNTMSILAGGPQLSGDESPETLLQLFQKNGITAALNRANQIPGVKGVTNFDIGLMQKTNPNIEDMNGAANVHLIDNMTKLAQVDKERNAFIQQYYQNNGGDLSGVNQAWLHEIGNDQPGSSRARVLSKFPVKTGIPLGGKMYDKVQSTDPSGFSYRLPGTY